MQGDNTPKELRNSWIGKWACLLTQAGYFRGVSHHHLVVGHTHEDIGGTLLKNNFSWCADDMDSVVLCLWHPV